MPAGLTVAVKVSGWPATEGLMLVVNWTVVLAAAPVPLSSTVCGTTPVPLRTTDPLAGPTPVGKKATFCVHVAAGTSVIGVAEQLPPATVVKVPFSATLETVMEAEPVFASVMLCEALGTPTLSLPKLRVGRAPFRIL
jgi:hypothetical protein